METEVRTAWLPHQDVRLAFRSSTANAWAASFLRRLQIELHDVRQADRSQCLRRICQRAQTLFETQASRQSHGPSHTVLGMCVLMLATYRELRDGAETASAARACVERCFIAAYQAFIENVCRPLLRNAGRSPRVLTGMNFRAWSQPMYPHQGATTGYHRCFIALGEPALAAIMHAADQAWIDAVASHGASTLDERRHTRAGDRFAAPEAGFAPFRFAARPAQRMASSSDTVLELQIHMGNDRRRPPDGGERRRNWSGIDRRQSSRRQDDQAAWQ